MSDTTVTVQSISTVRKIHPDGSISFSELSSWYRAAPHLEGIIRTALETRREVKFTTDRDCNIHAVELLPAPPSALGRVGKMAARLRLKLMRR